MEARDRLLTTLSFFLSSRSRIVAGPARSRVRHDVLLHWVPYSSWRRSAASSWADHPRRGPLERGQVSRSSPSHRRCQPRNRKGVHDDQNPECDDYECERHIEGGPGGQELL